MARTECDIRRRCRRAGPGTREMRAGAPPRSCKALGHARQADVAALCPQPVSPSWSGDLSYRTRHQALARAALGGHLRIVAEFGEHYAQSFTA